MKTPVVTSSELKTPWGSSIHYAGPGLMAGLIEQPPLPAFFYFSLSGQASLTLDPYNQPVAFLLKQSQLLNRPVRCYSLNLPGHGEPKSFEGAMKFWASSFAKEDIIQLFVKEAIESISYLIDQGYVDHKRIAVGGLSRGGFAALHLAAADPRIGSVLAFAPLLDLGVVSEFKEIKDSPLVCASSADHLVEKLVNRNVRLYIGNRDTCVGTEPAFRFIQKLAEAAYHSKPSVRSPKAELIIGPSVGHQGHGTLPHVFLDGAEWIINIYSS